MGMGKIEALIFLTKKNAIEKCECRCDHPKIKVRAEVHAENFLKCGSACAAQ